MLLEPSNEELRQRVELLEKESLEHKQARQELQEKERELGIRNRISHLFLTTPDNEMYAEVLQVVLEVMKSKYGVFGYINSDGALVCPSMTRDIWHQCQMPEKEIVFPREIWGGIWGKALIEKKSLYSNDPFQVPQGHIPILRAMDVPIIYQGKVIGNLMVGNKQTDYDVEDLGSLEAIANHIAPVLHARLQRDKHENNLIRTEQLLRQRTRYLSERVKELNCLYGISDLVVKPGISLNEIFQGVVDIIPQSWQHPEITCARIIFKDQEFTTKKFKDATWKQTCDINIHGETIGTLEVCYLEQRPKCQEGPFLAEERLLINAIAERLEWIIERQQAEEHIHILTQELIKAQENERLKISRDLHDKVAQDLSTLKIAFETLFNDETALPSGLRQKVLETSRTLQSTITAVRDLAYDLRPPGLDDIGLIPALSMFCEEFTEKSGVKVDFQSAGMKNLQLDPDSEINLYRLVQEGLNNIGKHANAREATIKLFGASPNIILRIEDGGKGFDMEAWERTKDSEKRMGLRSMQERVSLLHGKMMIQSRPRVGTQIFVKIPYQENKHGPEKDYSDR
jgi:signal transduction histidine kinase